MKLSDLAAQLAATVSKTLNAPLQEGQSATAEPMLTNKAMAAYGRKLDTGNIALRVVIITNADLPGDLGRMELFVPVNKKQLKRDPDTVLAAVLRFIGSAVSYRAEMIGRARERMTA